jgi:DNA polymerase-3 subunit beta
MEFRIAKEELIRALARVQGIVEKRSTNPIIANVLLEVSDDGMKVVATDTEISFVGRYKVECIRPGSLTLGARQLYEIARLVPTGEVVFCLPEGSTQMEIRSGRSFFKVLGLPAEDFPTVPAPTDAAGATIEAHDLKDLIDKTLFSITNDDTRTGLNGANLERVEGDRDVLRFVSTDGHRLSLCTRPYTGEWNPPRARLLLPRKGLAELRKLIDASEGSWGLSFAENQACFANGGITFSMRLLEGEFPDYNAVVPKGAQRKVTLSRDELSGALRRVAILASEKSQPIRFSIHGGNVTLKAQQPEAGEAVEDLDAQVDGPDLDIGFNARYFRDALLALSSDNVLVEVGDSLSPCLVKAGDGGDDELFVIMPMRLE